MGRNRNTEVGGGLGREAGRREKRPEKEEDRRQGGGETAKDGGRTGTAQTGVQKAARRPGNGSVGKR